MSQTLAIETHGLTKRYRRQKVVDSLDLKVPAGSIYAFLGHNGAGKTTTIRMLLNLLPTSSGSAEVLGRPSRKLRERDLEQVGYVTDNHPLPQWMRVGQLLRYLQPLYPTWDVAFEKELLKLFALDESPKIRQLSRGMKMKVALVAALAYRPKVLLMDEPFSGLDPGVREDLVQGLLSLGGEDGCTIFLSSHDVEEVERIADWVGIVHEGGLVLEESVESLQQRFRQIDLDLTKKPSPPEVAEWWRWEATARRASFVDTAYDAEETAAQVAALFPEASLTESPMSLREIYLAVEGQHREGA